jgi:hypothetical protein
VLLDGDLIQQDVNIHVLCESRDPSQTFQRVMVALNLCALLHVLALTFYRYVLDDQCVLSVLLSQTYSLVQWSSGNVMRVALNARGYALPSLKLLLDQYLCSDVLALTLSLLQGQQMLALLFRELVT